MTIDIRPATTSEAEAIAAVHVSSWRTAYRGLVDDATLDALSVPSRTELWNRRLSAPRDDQFVFVAEAAGDGIVGFVDAARIEPSDDGFEAELFAIYLLDSHRGRGLGRRLFRQAQTSVAAIGCRNLKLVVLADNPFRRFYDAMGGAVVAGGFADIGPQRLETVTYGWKRLTEEKPA